MYLTFSQWCRIDPKYIHLYTAQEKAAIRRMGGYVPEGPDAQPDPETSTELRQTVDQLFDDVATLPIFSGTCPRVADPGRFDPAPVSTDFQPSLF